MKSMPRALCVAAMLGLIAGCSLFDYSSIVSRRFALVYGVSRYVMSAAATLAPNLTYPADDATDVAAMCAANGYQVSSRWVDQSGQIYVNGTTTGGRVVQDGVFDAYSPSKANILADIAALRSQVGPNDVVIFYFSGHGMADTSLQREWFVPYGGVVESSPGTYGGNSVRSVEDSEFGGMLGVLSTPRKVVILDTCNSGGFIGNVLEVDILPASSNGGIAIITPAAIAQAISNYFTFQGAPNGISPYGGAMVLSAAGAAELSYETETYAHGVMTYFFLQAAQSGDLNHDGHITALEAFSVVKAGIDANWNSNWSVRAANECFEPRVSGGPIDFVIF
jgi:Caspase domain